jgi:hypothetical protein
MLITYIIPLEAGPLAEWRRTLGPDDGRDDEACTAVVSLVIIIIIIMLNQVSAVPMASRFAS